MGDGHKDLHHSQAKRDQTTAETIWLVAKENQAKPNSTKGTKCNNLHAIFFIDFTSIWESVI